MILSLELGKFQDSCRASTTCSYSYTSCQSFTEYNFPIDFIICLDHVLRAVFFLTAELYIYIFNIQLKSFFNFHVI